MADPDSNPGSFDSKVHTYSFYTLALCWTCRSALEVYEVCSNSTFLLLWWLGSVRPIPVSGLSPCIFLGPSCPLFGATVALQSTACMACMDEFVPSATLVTRNGSLVPSELNSSAPDYSRQKCRCCSRSEQVAEGLAQSVSAVWPDCSSVLFWKFTPSRNCSHLLQGQTHSLKSLEELGNWSKESIS